jgi:hypothetical protein
MRKALAFILLSAGIVFSGLSFSAQFTDKMAIGKSTVTNGVLDVNGAVYANSYHGDGSALTGLTKSQVSLNNVDNTSDANKPVSSATQTALNLKENTLTKGDISAGTGVSITGGTGAVIGTGVSVTNTAPDQTVSLTAGTGISTSGTYPNFTITNTLPETGVNWDAFPNTQGYITTWSETDPVYSASSWNTTDNNSINWDTAFSWGDHSGEGYLKTVNWDEMPTVQSSQINWSIVDETVLTAVNWDNYVQIGDNISDLNNDSGYLTSVNWDAFPNTQGYLASVNWSEGTELNMAGVNWTDFIRVGEVTPADWATISGDQSSVNISGFTNDSGYKTAINWVDIGGLQTDVNGSGFNWTDTSALTPTFVTLDQTTPQTIINGVPLMTTAVDEYGSGDQLVNMDYVRGGTWLIPPIIEWYDPTDGLPVDPAIGDRYGADATANGWTIDYIYEWDGDSWVESEPEDGWMLWDIWGMMFWAFFSGGWMEVGSGSFLDLAETNWTADSPLSFDTDTKHLSVDLSSKQNELGLTGSSGNVSGTTFTATTFTGALNGNASTVTTNANLTGPITSVGNATSVAAQTGTGSTFAMSVAPTFTGNVTAGTVTATTFTGALNGNATTATGALGLVAGTYADGKYCTYTASGTVLNCNSEGGGGSGTVEGTFVAGRVTFASGTSTLTDDGDMTFSTDTLTATKIVAPTSVSTPSLISTGAIGITPAAGSGFNVSTSTTTITGSTATKVIVNAVPAGDLTITQATASGYNPQGKYSNGVEFRNAQRFTLSQTTTILGASFYTSTNVGSPSGQITVRIETDSSNPSGTLAHVNATAAITPTQSAKNSVTYTSFTLAAGTYWLKLDCSNQTTNNYWNIGYASGNPYANGWLNYSYNGAWQVPTASTLDMSFEILTASAGTSDIGFQTGGVTKWTMGSDGSDSDKFKIGSTALGTGTALTISGTTLTYATPFVLGTTTVTTTGTQLNYLNAATGTTGTTSSNVVFSAAPTFTTSISTPSIVTASGALGITPASGSNLNVTLGTTGDLAVNTNQLYVDTSAAMVGINTATPSSELTIFGGSTVSATINGVPAGQGGIDSYTVTALHMDGVNDGTTFTDSEITPKTYTANGTAKTKTGEKKFGTASGYFDGSGWLSSPDSTDFTYGTSPFTIDFWFRPDNGAQESYCVSQGNNTVGQNTVTAGAGAVGFMSYKTGSGYAIAFNAAYTFTSATWYHIAVVRVNTDNAATGWRVFIDGVSKTLTKTQGSWNASLVDSTGNMHIGGWDGAGNARAYLDEVRISKGIARWTSDFTPPTRAYDTDPLVAQPSVTFQSSGTTKWTIGSDGSDSDKFKIGSTALGTGTALSIAGTATTFLGTVTMPTPFTLGATSVTTTGTQLNYLNAATGTTGTTSSNLVFSASPTFTGTTSHAIITASGTFYSTATNDLGWTVKSAANTACNTTCVYACVHGWDTSSGEVAVSCTDATADKCLCAGVN